MTGMLISPEFYGETWKVSDDDQKCTEISSPTTENCENQVRNPPPPPPPSLHVPLLPP